MTELIHLTPDMAPAVERFWEESFPHRPLTSHLLRERIFAAPDTTPENMLAYAGDNGRLTAISLLSPPAGIDDPDARPTEGVINDRIGGLRWFGVHPAARGKGLGRALLDESCARLAAAGANMVDFLITPPYYLQPGVDVRDTATISWLLHHGFQHYRTNFNMTVDLQRFRAPEEAAIFDADHDGFFVRRATPEDAAPFRAFVLREWTPGWATEGAIGLRNDPVSLFVAIRPLDATSEAVGGAPVYADSVTGDGEIVGFAAYEANQGLGCFGPTGVSPLHQGRGLGRKLLFATLVDMKKLGRRQSEIGWVGPVEFYYRACGAILGPVFWGLRKRMDNLSK